MRHWQDKRLVRTVVAVAIGVIAMAFFTLNHILWLALAISLVMNAFALAGIVMFWYPGRKTIEAEEKESKGEQPPKFYWREIGLRLVARWLLLVSSIYFALGFITVLKYHNGAYYPFFGFAVLAATCFGVGRRMGWIQFALGVLFLFPAVMCPNY
jgi:hypothetical protein